MADAQDQRDALATCFLATAMSEVDHKIDQPVEALRWLLQCHRTTISAEGLTSVDDKTINALIALWDRYLVYGRAALMSLGSRVIVSPVLVPGFAIPDLIVGRTLVDIKTYQDPGNELELWLDQILSYALLDRWNNLSLDGVAIYAGWHAVLLRIGFGELLHMSGIRSHETMDALRRDFNEAMHDELDEAAYRHHPDDFHRSHPKPEPRLDTVVAAAVGVRSTVRLDLPDWPDFGDRWSVVLVNPPFGSSSKQRHWGGDEDGAEVFRQDFVPNDVPTNT